MSVKRILKDIRDLVKDFDLKYKPEYFSYLIVSKEDIVLRNFLGGCPEPDYSKFGGKKEENRGKNVAYFVKSREFLRHKKEPQGCVISKKEAKQELSLARKISDKSLRKKYVKLYNKIINCMVGDELILVFKPKNRKEKNIFRGVLSHEIVHQVLGSNNLRFSKIKESFWKWEEGICVYMDHFMSGKHKRFAKQPKKTERKLWNIYSEYANKWYKIIEKAKTPTERKQAILRKYQELNKK